MRLETTISALTATHSVHRANRDRLENVQADTNTFYYVWKSKISITDLYEFIRHMHECKFKNVYQYGCSTTSKYSLCSIRVG